MRGTWRLRHWARRLAPKALILLYHRVAEVSADPQLLCVSPRHFAEHLDVLQREYHLLSLRDLRRRLALNLWLPRSVVITFDDGYADNLTQARPLLAQADAPATVFIATGQLGGQREFWWDELERIFLSTPALPAALELSLDGHSCRWVLSPNDAPASDNPSWHVLMQTTPSPRQALYRELAANLRPLDPAHREALLAQLWAWAALPRSPRPEQRILTADEARALAADGLVEIGAHTMTHPVLSALSPQSQRAEIAGSKRQLEEILDQPVTSFSYPYGGQGDYTDATVRLTRESGFHCACANFPAPVRWGVHPYRLPRFLVRDWDGDEFARRLEGWFAG